MRQNLLINSVYLALVLLMPLWLLSGCINPIEKKLGGSSSASYSGMISTPPAPEEKTFTDVQEATPYSFEVSAPLAADAVDPVITIEVKPLHGVVDKCEVNKTKMKCVYTSEKNFPPTEANASDTMKVKVIDGSFESGAATITFVVKRLSPVPIALSGDNSKLSNEWGNPSLWLIDDTQLDLRKGKPTLICPKLAAAKNTVYGVGSNTNKLYEVDFSQGKVLRSIAVGKNPSRTTIDDKGRVWVANRDGNSVTCVNPSANTNVPLGRCFADGKDIPAGSGTRALGAEKVSDTETRIWVLSYDGKAVNNLTRVTVTNLPGGVLEKAVKVFSMKTADGSNLAGYGGYFSQLDEADLSSSTSVDTTFDRLFWVSARGQGRVVALKIAADGTPSLFRDINLNGSCDPYGIGMDLLDKMPLVACHGANRVIKIHRDRVDFFDPLGRNPRGVAGDAYGKAWVALDDSNQVGRLSLTADCAVATAALNCQGASCTLGSKSSKAVASSCSEVRALPGGSFPIGVSAMKEAAGGNAFVVGHSNATMYEFKGIEFSLVKGVQFEKGASAYMYSDFTGASSGYKSATKMLGFKCLGQGVTSLQVNVLKNDPLNKIATKYYCDNSNAIGATGASYLPLSPGKDLEDCVGKSCIHFEVSFEHMNFSGKTAEQACQSMQLYDLEIIYQVPK
ncbi:MAG: hypothetical protein HQK50_02850 [Oligoflexia bacterium]|nr:hypothetical protein [Oligoflexia bacterium]MBF0364480.1 hypothetical protein [Oligoflexia bacterium]